MSATPTTVLRLANMATREELSDPTEYEDIISDIAGALTLPAPPQRTSPARPSLVVHLRPGPSKFL